jgi:hypothetical protein
MSVEVLWEFPVHPTEELLEEYGFGRVREPALTVLEEHLFACVSCQAKLEELVEYAALMKVSLASFERDQTAPRGILLPFAIPKIPWAHVRLAAGIVLVLLGATSVWRSQSVPSTASVQLAALRGGDGPAGGFAQAPARRPLDLIVNTASLPASSGYRLELVSQSGGTVWTGEAKIAGAKLSAHVSSGPGPGVYWVRLYSTHDETTRGELLREFGMRLE